MVKTLHFQYRGGRIQSCRELRSTASGPKKKTKQKQYCNKFSEDFKNGPHQKNIKRKNKLILAHESATSAALSRDGSSPPTQLHLIGCISLSPSHGLYIMATSRCTDFSYVGSRLPRHLFQEREPGGNWVSLHCFASEVMKPYFCQVLLIQASSSKPAQAEGEGERDSTC